MQVKICCLNYSVVLFYTYTSQEKKERLSSKILSNKYNLILRQRNIESKWEGGSGLYLDFQKAIDTTQEY